jgi:two-component system, chemotaxis family, chemotaxis protein CheY
MTTTILVVDDSSAVRAYVRAALEDAGELDAQVEEAVSGVEALRLLPRQHFDLLILDINMPNIHGLELISMLRRSEAYKDTPVLVISSESSERDKQRALELGADGFLAKPFEAEALLSEVGRLFASRSERA